MGSNCISSRSLLIFLLLSFRLCCVINDTDHGVCVHFLFNARCGIRLHRSLIFVFSNSFNKFPFGFAYPLVFRSWCYCWLYQSFINIVSPSTTKHWYLSELNLQIPRVHDMSHLMTKPTK